MTHAGTLFPVFMPNVTAAGLRPVGPPVVAAIQAALQAEHLPIDTLGELDPWQLAVAKTADRGILSTRNNLVLTTEHVIATNGGLAHCDINTLHYGVHRTDNSITGYTPPITWSAAAIREVMTVAATSSGIGAVRIANIYSPSTRRMRRVGRCRRSRVSSITQIVYGRTAVADQEPAQPQSSPPPSTQGGPSGAKPPPPPIHWQTEAIAKRELHSSSLGRAALDVVRMV